MAAKKPVIPEGKTRIKVPRVPGSGDDNYFVSVNGKNFLIPRGVEVEVPDYVAQEYYRSEAAKEKFYNTQDNRRNTDKV